MFIFAMIAKPCSVNSESLGNIRKTDHADAERLRVTSVTHIDNKIIMMFELP